MVKKKDEKSSDEAVPDQEIPEAPEGTTTDTNAGPDAVSGTIANETAEGTAPHSHAGEPVDTNGGK